MHASRFLKILIASALFVGATSTGSTRPTPGKAPDAAQAHIEGDEAKSWTVDDDRVVRFVHFDICWPATNGEYRALGKHAILMLTASSILPAELPLTSVYVQTDGVTVPLQRIADFDPSQSQGTASAKGTHTNQVSFYLLPIR